MPAFTYYRRAKDTLGDLYREGVVIESDDWPTLHYYGTVTLSRPLSHEELERLSMVEADEETTAHEAEAGALYRAETRHMP